MRLHSSPGIKLCSHGVDPPLRLLGAILHKLGRVELVARGVMEGEIVSEHPEMAYDHREGVAYGAEHARELQREAVRVVLPRCERLYNTDRRNNRSSHRKGFGIRLSHRQHAVHYIMRIHAKGCVRLLGQNGMGHLCAGCDRWAGTFHPYLGIFPLLSHHWSEVVPEALVDVDRTAGVCHPPFHDASEQFRLAHNRYQARPTTIIRFSSSSITSIVRCVDRPKHVGLGQVEDLIVPMERG